MSCKMIEYQRRITEKFKDSITTLAMRLIYLLPFEFVKADLLLGEFFKTEAGVFLERRSRHRNIKRQRET